MSGSVGTPDFNYGVNAQGVNTSGYEVGPQAAVGENVAPLEASLSHAPGNQFQPQPNVLGLGAVTALPAGSTNGTPLAAMPSGATGVVLYIPAAGSVSYSIQKAQPTSAPASVTQPGNPSGGITLLSDIPLAGGEMLYVTASTGQVEYRYR